MKLQRLQLLVYTPSQNNGLRLLLNATYRNAQKRTGHQKPAVSVQTKAHALPYLFRFFQNPIQICCHC